MGLAIFFRKRLAVNKFRELLIKSLDSGLGNEAIICSGFFQECFGKSKYQVSLEYDFQTVLLGNNIKLKTIGIHNNFWIASYKNFRDNLKSNGVNINAKLSKNLRWHAKVYILLKDKLPIFAIVGSSNMTRNAFSITSPFNFETDVVLWLDEFPKFKKLMEKEIQDLAQNQSEVIIAKYNKKDNYGLSLEQKLKQLIDDIENLDLEDLL